MKNRQITISKFLSKRLRHSPESIGIALDSAGWTSIDGLLAAAAAHGFAISRAELDEVVAHCEKQRFAVDASGTRIRANQGHSVALDLQLPTAVPPAELFHGTVAKFLDAILAQGLKKMGRQHVHLSVDIATAEKVGARRGKPVVLRIDAAKMAADGCTFWLSANGVWLVDAVPPRYLRSEP